MKKSNLYILILLAIILAVMNISIWQKEKILANGEIVYLKLAPVDPRSLMQGDYMQLRYNVDNELREPNPDKHHASNTDAPYAKTVVVRLDEKNIAHYARLADTAVPLQANERRFRLSGHYAMHIKPNTFFFQEGHGKFYERAEYGMFTFSKNNPDHYILSGLADKTLKKIIPINDNK